MRLVLEASQEVAFSTMIRQEVTKMFKSSEDGGVQQKLLIQLTHFQLLFAINLIEVPKILIDILIIKDTVIPCAASKIRTIVYLNYEN